MLKVIRITPPHKVELFDEVDLGLVSKLSIITVHHLKPPRLSKGFIAHSFVHWGDVNKSLESIDRQAVVILTMTLIFSLRIHLLLSLTLQLMVKKYINILSEQP
ncbi:hypothetical protein GQX74_013006 [Glossina fuscipes]|nr:hypothetical protein GQX74_013006 [Glossina fuscipes]